MQRKEKRKTAPRRWRETVCGEKEAMERGESWLVTRESRKRRRKHERTNTSMRARQRVSRSRRTAAVPSRSSVEGLNEEEQSKNRQRCRFRLGTNGLPELLTHSPVSALRTCFRGLAHAVPLQLGTTQTTSLRLFLSPSSLLRASLPQRRAHAQRVNPRHRAAFVTVAVLKRLSTLQDLGPSGLYDISYTHSLSLAILLFFCLRQIVAVKVHVSAGTSSLPLSIPPASFPHSAHT